MKRVKPCLVVVLTLIVTPLLAGCNGNLFNQPDYTLGVPYRSQEQFNDCVPASIQMWRLHDGLSNVSQTTIFNTIGGAPCDPYDAAYGVSYYTNSGSDAFFDHEFNPSTADRDDLVSRQITSIDVGIPVMALVRSQTHVGIINGGKYEVPRPDRFHVGHGRLVVEPLCLRRQHRGLRRRWGMHAQ